MRGIAFCCAAALAMGFCSTHAIASLIATATISSTQLGPNSYEYDLTLTNTGTTNIGTFWFGWIPAYDLLPAVPTIIGKPTAWAGIDASDSFGIASVQWVNTTTPLQPGHTLGGFFFDTSSPPAVIGGTSAFFNLPVEQSYVYIGAPETDPGYSLVPTTVAAPEPSAISFFGPIALVLVRRGRRR